jgi:uncharacterized protein YbjQ (UPF0145 family)
MKTLLGVGIAVGLLLATAWPARARDDKLLLPVAAVLEGVEARQKLDGSVKFYFGRQPHPKIVSNFRSDVTNLKTNAVNKSDEKACEWVFLSALVALEKRAKQLGANAVVNIVSYYKKVPMSSETEYECHAGNVLAGVALKGDFVKVAER